MPAIQPIPQNKPTSSSVEAQQVLALHERTTQARTRTPARWTPSTQRSSTAGENSGRRVR